MHIDSKPELKNTLKGKIILLTGAGGGIGYEAAKAFAYMGAKIIIAEINRDKGLFAESHINSTFIDNPATFYEIDLSDEKQLYVMVDFILKNFGCPDVIMNNATITKMGAVDDVDIGFWDKSYAVNLKAPLLLAQMFLPKMKERKSGVLVFVSSSGASPYMGAYEVFKTAQVELSSTLAMELEGSGIYAFTIGPGLVKTETAMNAIEIVAESMGMSTDAFYEMNSQHILDVENAGIGFALSVVNPKKYHGLEIGSIQVLTDYGMLLENKVSNDETGIKLTTDDICIVENIFLKIQKTFEQQYTGWQGMNVFERQWVFRDFKKSMGIPADQASEKLNRMLQQSPLDITALKAEYDLFCRLCNYWKHQLKMMQGYEKDKSKLAENTTVIQGWISDIELLLTHL